jgi:hypothetical protein
VQELEGQLQAKEQERSQAAAECNRLEKELADQATRHAEQVRLATRPSGERSFYAKDPFGNPLCFVDEQTVVMSSDLAG